MYLYTKTKKASRLAKFLFFLPGFIVANIVSLLVSRPGDRLFQSGASIITDQPILVGFPLSFYEIGAWGDNQFYLFAFVVNIITTAALGILFAGRPQARTDK